MERFEKLVDNKLVYWTGELKSERQIASHMKGSGGVLLASKYESVGLVALEALACGVRIMVPNFEHLRDYYGNAVWYCDQPDNKKFLVQLRDFYNSDLQRANVVKLYKWSDVGKMIHDVYKSIL